MSHNSRSNVQLGDAFSSFSVVTDRLFTSNYITKYQDEGWKLKSGTQEPGQGKRFDRGRKV